MFSLSDENRKYYIEHSRSICSEQNLLVVELIHKETLAKILLFVCDDENRVFNIAFKTPVWNGKGMPHILEHSVLCGSRKYNVKDPFIELAKGSLNTFLNAFTFPDKTCYPVASANLKDFHNLVDVYLDAVFYPNAIKDERIFRQEGWHYEIKDLDDELTVNGVVYNEMRGVYSDPDSLLETNILASLYKGTNYEYEYGGAPNEIINLTYEEFCDFHKKYYSASNSIIYYYGKLDFNEELLSLEKNYLSDFHYVDVSAEFSENTKYVKDEIKVDYYSSDEKDLSDKSYIAYSYSIDKKKDTIKNIVLAILDYVLFTSESAIIKEKLLNAGFAKSIYSHVELGIKNGFYAIIAQNIDETKLDEFIRNVKDITNEIRNTGLPVDKLKAGINSLYFDYAEDEFSNMPRGLYFSLASLDSYLYGDSYDMNIKYKEAFDYINSIDFNDKNNIFFKVMDEVFIDNNHTSINILRPSNTYAKEKEDFLKTVLKNRKDGYSEIELNEIIKSDMELKTYQNTPDSETDLSKIPSLKVSDIDKYKKVIDYDIITLRDIKVLMNYNNPKDIVYLGIDFDISKLSDIEFYLLSIINSLYAKIDFSDMTYNDFNNFVDINTGGLSIKVNMYDNKTYFSFSVKSIVDNQKFAYDIFHELITKYTFDDTKRISIILNETRANSFMNMLSSGHVASANRALSNILYSSNIYDKISDTGIGFNRFIAKFCDGYTTNSDLYNETLYLLTKKIFTCGFDFNICVNKEYDDKCKSYLMEFIDKLNIYMADNKFTTDNERILNNNLSKISEILDVAKISRKSNSEAFITSNDINFCSIAGKFDKNDYVGRLSLLRTLFNYEYLWTNIRVLGGAYGCMSRFNRYGTYVFSSFRDPNISKTNKTYIGVKDFLKNAKFSDDKVEKFIIGTMGTYDNPISTKTRHNINIAAYRNNLTDTQYNAERMNVLETKSEDIKILSKIFDSIDSASEKCALISKNMIEEAKKEYDEIISFNE